MFIAILWFKLSWRLRIACAYFLYPWTGPMEDKGLLDLRTILGEKEPRGYY